MTGTAFAVVYTVDFAPPFAEDAFAEDTVRKFALEIQETELGSLNLF